ncbi:MAG TPA: hypothetical protein VK111_03165 [Virgibacillus sp.]|nr:hypothetical protein [Virgibacillus sp.]
MSDNNKNDKNNDELSKWDIILAHAFVSILMVGILLGGIVLYNISN